MMMLFRALITAFALWAATCAPVAAQTATQVNNALNSVQVWGQQGLEINQQIFALFGDIDAYSKLLESDDKPEVLRQRLAAQKRQTDDKIAALRAAANALPPLPPLNGALGPDSARIEELARARGAFLQSQIDSSKAMLDSFAQMVERAIVGDVDATTVATELFFARTIGALKSENAMVETMAPMLSNNVRLHINDAAKQMNLGFIALFELMRADALGEKVDRAPYIARIRAAADAMNAATVRAKAKAATDRAGLAADLRRGLTAAEVALLRKIDGAFAKLDPIIENEDQLAEELRNIADKVSARSDPQSLQAAIERTGPLIDRRVTLQVAFLEALGAPRT